MGFAVGDIVECIDGHIEKGPYTIMEIYRGSGGNLYLNLNDGYGGLYPSRFRLVSAAQMDAEEYEEIMEGQEIYQQLQRG